MDDEFELETFKEVMHNLDIEGYNPKYFLRAWNVLYALGKNEVCIFALKGMQKI